MLTYVIGNLFTSPAKVLVNTVNTVGVMGKGLAKQFKTFYPEMFVEYQQLCERGELQPGRLHYYRGINKDVLNFPTKRNWRQPSRIEDIEAGLRTFVDQYETYSIDSVAFPQLGCGNGELDWESQVRPLMERYLGPLPIAIYIHLYEAGSEFKEHRSVEEMKAWLNTEPESLPFAEVWSDVAAASEALSEADLDGWKVTIGDPASDLPLTLERPNETIEVSADELRDLWIALKSFGFLAENDLPSSLQPAGKAFMNLLDQLEYVQRSRYILVSDLDADGPLTTEDFVTGVRLAPRSTFRTPAVQQLEFLSQV
jgi:O-acetyl-ADP-ribose deacetylase (regulator of RNase III)